jgi:hypothetical protein
MSELRFCFGFKLRYNTPDQCLAQFYTLSGKRIDVPDRALGTDTVVIERNQLVECLRRESIDEASCLTPRYQARPKLSLESFVNNLCDPDRHLLS